MCVFVLQVFVNSYRDVERAQPQRLLVNLKTMIDLLICICSPVGSQAHGIVSHEFGAVRTSSNHCLTVGAKPMA